MKQEFSFLDYDQVKEKFKDKTVVIVGSAPSCLTNSGRWIDERDIIVRVNNYHLEGRQHCLGTRTDVYYSFFGSSIRKSKYQLMSEGVTLCMAKCPNTRFIESEWHVRRRREEGIDFRRIYEKRRDWWFCDTYIPEQDRFMSYFELLDDHIPSTGFSCILDILSFECKEIYLTGFDFFASGIHNIDEKWRRGREDDPIRHMPSKELAWLVNNYKKYPVILDDILYELVNDF